VQGPPTSLYTHMHVHAHRALQSCMSAVGRCWLVRVLHCDVTGETESYSSLYLQVPAQCPTQSRHLINVCWLNEWRSVWVCGWKYAWTNKWQRTRKSGSIHGKIMGFGLHLNHRSTINWLCELEQIYPLWDRFFICKKVIIISAHNIMMRIKRDGVCKLPSKGLPSKGQCRY